MRVDSGLFKSDEKLEPACERAHLLITRHIDGEASPEDALALRAHLGACAKCRKSLEIQSSQSVALAEALKGLWPDDKKKSAIPLDAVAAKRRSLLRAASLLIVIVTLLYFARSVTAPSGKNATQAPELPIMSSSKPVETTKR